MVWSAPHLQIQPTSDGKYLGGGGEIQKVVKSETRICLTVATIYIAFRLYQVL